jgi:ATP-binding cassette subfamily B (MDR/TAP) protein 1
VLSWILPQQTRWSPKHERLRNNNGINGHHAHFNRHLSPFRIGCQCTAMPVIAMHTSESRSVRHSARISMDANAESSETQPLLNHADGSHHDAASRRRSITQWDRHVEPSLATVQPQFDDIVAVKNVFLKQILGLNPFKTSYFALYRPLDDFTSRTILALGISFAMAAGIPLPLIGVILGRIINNFPPPADELRALLIRLMSVAVGYFAVTWGWAVCWAVIGERVSRRLREKQSPQIWRTY